MSRSDPTLPSAELAVLLATLPGVPVIHAGQEIGETRAKQVVRGEKGDKDLLRFYQRLFRLRRRHRALIDGDISNVWAGSEPLVAYLRRSGDNEIVAAINFGVKAVRASLQLPGPAQLAAGRPPAEDRGASVRAH